MIKKLFEEHKFARRFTLFWLLGIITWVVARVLNPEYAVLIDMPLATVLTSIIALCGTFATFYERHREQDDKK